MHRNLEKAMAPHSSTLAWKIPWTEEPGRLQSMGSLRVGHDGATSLSLFTFMHWRRKWQPTPVFLPGESQGRRSLVGCRHGVTQSRTQLKWLSSSSSRLCNKLWSLYSKELFAFYSHSEVQWGTSSPECWFSHSPQFVSQVLGVRGHPSLSWAQLYEVLKCWLVDHYSLSVWCLQIPEVKNM